MANITISEIILPQVIEFPELSDLELETVIGGKLKIKATGDDARDLLDRL